MALQPFLETFKIEKPNMGRQINATFKALRRDIT